MRPRRNCKQMSAREIQVYTGITQAPLLLTQLTGIGQPPAGLQHGGFKRARPAGKTLLERRTAWMVCTRYPSPLTAARLISPW